MIDFRATYGGMSIAVGLRRVQTGITLLHGEDEELLRRMRAHGNFIEYVPMILLLMALIELSKGAGGCAVNADANAAGLSGNGKEKPEQKNAAENAGNGAVPVRAKKKLRRNRNSSNTGRPASSKSSTRI